MNGSRLRELRRKKGLSQEELGSMLGVGKSAICCYEKGTRNPSLESVIELMQIFAVSADYLLGTDELIRVMENETENYRVMTKEEVKFIEELKKDKMIYDILLEDPKRGSDLVKKKIG